MCIDILQLPSEAHFTGDDDGHFGIGKHCVWFDTQVWVMRQKKGASDVQMGISGQVWPLGTQDDSLHLTKPGLQVLKVGQRSKL